jgi:ABC-2 type transport system ATP-binding protein
MGKTIVLTTHYLDEAQQLADRIAVVVGGRIIACDSPQRLADRHVAPTRINFEVPAEKITRMPITTGVSFESRGDHVTIEANDPGEQLEALLSWARTEDLTLGALSVSPPSLEDTYLRLVGDYVTEEAS